MALHIACMECDASIVKALLEAGADAAAIDKVRHSALRLGL